MREVWGRLPLSAEPLTEAEAAAIIADWKLPIPFKRGGRVIGQVVELRRHVAGYLLARIELDAPVAPPYTPPTAADLSTLRKGGPGGPPRTEG